MSDGIPPLELADAFQYSAGAQATCRRHKIIAKGDPEWVERAALEHLKECKAAGGHVLVSRWLTGPIAGLAAREADRVRQP